MAANETLAAIAQRAVNDLFPHREEFDAVIAPGDMHGAPIAGAIAAGLDKPLMIVCVRRHFCCVSHIVTIGECRPDHRYVHVDDWFWGGDSLHHTLAAMKHRRMFRYLNRSAPAPVVATYAAVQRKYEVIG